MRAGLARECINPPLGTRLFGFAARDLEHGCIAVHDDISVRAAYLEHAGQAVLLMGFDLCFLGRAEVDRLKQGTRDLTGLPPERVLLNTSHSHVGPAVGTWHWAGYTEPDRRYVALLEAATLEAARQAVASAREVTLWAGVGQTRLPLSRRRIARDGRARWEPSPDGLVHDALPVCLMKGVAGEPVCLLFSVSCHPSMMSGFEVSAEYPGAAMRRLEQRLGAPVSLFLQGTGGDAKPRVVGGGEQWRSGTWEEMDQAGRMVADGVIGVLEGGLCEVQPDLHAHLVEARWPLQPARKRQEYAAVAGDPNVDPFRRLWAGRIVEALDRGEALPAAAPIRVHGVQFGKGLRLSGMEGEAVAGWGRFIQGFYGGGVTFPLGYSNGQGLYLPTSDQMDEGGYEVESYWEYGYPARLAEGMEAILTDALGDLRARGVG